VNALRDHNKDVGDGEDMRGQMGVAVVNDALATSTTLTAAVNQERIQVWSTRNMPTWFVESAAAIGAVQAFELIPNRNMDGVPVPGLKPPPVQSRWTGLERKNLLASGASPLHVIAGDIVTLRRAVTTRVLNAAGASDYTLFGQEVILGLDAVRDEVIKMLDRDYGRARWFDDPDEDTVLPEDAAYPRKVKDSLINVARQLEGLGICQRVDALQDEFKVTKVSANEGEYQIPSDIVEGLHKLRGKQILIRR
jgi:phage tail sheath gpL-like